MACPSQACAGAVRRGSGYAGVRGAPPRQRPSPALRAAPTIPHTGGAGSEMLLPEKMESHLAAGIELYGRRGQLEDIEDLEQAAEQVIIGSDTAQVEI